MTQVEQHQVPVVSGGPPPQPNVHHGVVVFEAGPVRSRAEVKITTAGLLAVGALVSGIILSVAPLVWTATSVARERARKGKQ